jgi:hypothetical protein
MRGKKPRGEPVAVGGRGRREDLAWRNSREKTLSESGRRLPRTAAGSLASGAAVGDVLALDVVVGYQLGGALDN